MIDGTSGDFSPVLTFNEGAMASPSGRGRGVMVSRRLPGLGPGDHPPHPNPLPPQTGGEETRVRRLRLVFVLALAFPALLAACGGKIEPGQTSPPPALPAPEHQGVAVRESQPIWHQAVGTVRSRTETTVAARITGTVESVHADAGARVRAGQTLAAIDQREVKARLEQAKSALAAAVAEAARAEADYRRTAQLHEKEAATPAQYEAAEAARKQAEAGVAMARERVRETEVAINYSRIVSPITGLVAQRLVEAGDLARPGEPLFRIHDPQDLRLEADIREGLIAAVAVGDAVVVELPALELEVDGEVDEIVPSADPRSRTFLIKVAVPATEGLLPGMFGRVHLSSGSREAVFAPEEAVERVGQLMTVLVQDGDRWTRRYVTAGAVAGGRLEILSGLDGGETLGWNR